LGAGLVLIFLSSLAIIFPNADLADQFDPLTDSHPLAIEPFGFDTPCGAVDATHHRDDQRLMPFSLYYALPKICCCRSPLSKEINCICDCNTLADFTTRVRVAN
jgi:hypothetical protein